MSDPLRELGRQLPYDRPDAARRDAVRGSLLVAASEGRPPVARSRWLLVGSGFAAGALAAAAVAILVLRPASPTSPTTPRDALATIESSSAAELERSMVATPTGTDELVRVRSGKVRLAVPKVRDGDHVRVRTGDAEVEGSGAYEVTVTADTLASVTVATGTATVRITGQQQTVFLAAGETWRASVVTADLDIAPAKPDVAHTTPSSTATPTTVTPTTVTPPTATPSTALPSIATSATAAPAAARTTPPTTITPGITSRTNTSRTTTPRTTATATSAPTTAAPTTESQPAAPAPRTSIIATAEPAPIVTGNSPTEQSFRAGHALLRANDYAAAAVELGKAADGDGPLAADAQYFQAIALTKAGRGAEAERALVAFLDRAPGSVRRGRAAVMLARRIVGRGDEKSARAWFESALGDPDPAVSSAARAGLHSLRSQQR